MSQFRALDRAAYCVRKARITGAAQTDKLLGHPLKPPKIGVLIGRLANMNTEALDIAQQAFADVKSTSELNSC
jgi:hypothetical protein